MVFFVLPAECMDFILPPTWTTPPTTLPPTSSFPPTIPPCQRPETYESSLVALGHTPPDSSTWAVVPVYTARGRMQPGPTELPIGGPAPTWDPPRLLALPPSVTRDPHAIAAAASQAAGAVGSYSALQPALWVVARSLNSPLPTTPPPPTHQSPPIFTALTSRSSGPKPAWPSIHTGCAIVAVWEEDYPAPARAAQPKPGILAAPPPGDATLIDCFDAFMAPEELGANDRWFCPGCQTHQRAIKSLDLWKVPEVLIVHLKRFRAPDFLAVQESTVTSGGNKTSGNDNGRGPNVLSPNQTPSLTTAAAYATRTKRDELVRFPLDNLSLGDRTGSRTQSQRLMSPCSDPPTSSSPLATKQQDDATYDLYAVDCHKGSATGGHYTAAVRIGGSNFDPLTNKDRPTTSHPSQGEGSGAEDDQWFVFDDSRIRVVPPAEVVNNQAYLLFYAKRKQEHRTLSSSCSTTHLHDVASPHG